jgi:hypothetical protein
MGHFFNHPSHVAFGCSIARLIGMIIQIGDGISDGNPGEIGRDKRKLDQYEAKE